MPTRKKTGTTARKTKTVTKKKVTKKKVAARSQTAKKTTRKTAAKKVAKKKVVAKKTTAKKATAKKVTRKKIVKKTAAKKVTTAAKPRKSALEGPTIKPYETKRGEDYMNEPQREHFREILLNWKMELMQEVDRTVHHMKDEAANFPDPNDRATQESEFSLELRTRDRERKLIKKIEEAIGTVDSGDYGYCESCGIEIGVRRLEARPTATQCIDCKTLDEIREKQMGG